MSPWPWLVPCLVAAASDSDGAGEAKAAWRKLEAVARGGEADLWEWQDVVTSLHRAHPHAEASAALAWLYLFGLPESGGGGAGGFAVRRDVEAAVGTAREGALVGCGRCWALLGFLMGAGFGPLLGAAHVTKDSSGRPGLIFLGPVTPREGPDALRLPRDLGAPDPAAVAYFLAGETGDSLGLLAVAYLSRGGMVNLSSFLAPGPNQAASIISRRVQNFSEALCHPVLAKQLGKVAEEVVQEDSWGPVPGPLSASSGASGDAAFVAHALTAPGASGAEVARAARLLETQAVREDQLPQAARNRSVEELFQLAAKRGDQSSALRAAVDLLQKNATEEARDLLEAAKRQEDPATAAMASYYNERFVLSNASEESVAEARGRAWPHLVRAADLGREDAQLLVAHSLVQTSADDGRRGADGRAEAVQRYRRLVNSSRGNLTEVQAFAAYNLGVLQVRADNSEGVCLVDSQELFLQVVLSQSRMVHLALLLERRAWRLGDELGARLLAMLLSDLGHDLGHRDSAHLWDQVVSSRGPRLEGELAEKAPKPCQLRGWWNTSSEELLKQNVSRLFAAAVKGGGFEMFNASGDVEVEGLDLEVSLPQPERSDFRHLHSFLWHSTYEAFPDGGPVPVALQPPAAVPHLVEFHHQRGKLTMDRHCNTAVVEGMFVNWTFHRLDALQEEVVEAAEVLMIDEEAEATSRDFLHCWVRPEQYFVELQSKLENMPPTTSTSEGDLDLWALTTSNDCPCYGGFACRGGDGACKSLARQQAAAGEEHSACHAGAKLCREVPADLEPPRSNLAAAPDVCAFYFHRRAAAEGNVDAMHILSHAYSNGHRGAAKDTAAAFAWSWGAMEAGDLRGTFDVAYSLEFGLGTPKDADRAFEMYREILAAQGYEGEVLGAKAASLLALLAASGRYWAGRLYGG